MKISGGGADSGEAAEESRKPQEEECPGHSGQLRHLSFSAPILDCKDIFYSLLYKLFGALRSAAIFPAKRPSAKQLMKIVYKHWKIESMHWILDVTSSEKDCRFLSDDAHRSMNILRKFAIAVHKNFLAASH